MQDQDHKPRHVPFGYEPPEAKRKGTLIVYDAFEGSGGEVLAEHAAQCAERLAFSALVLYPLHEETLRRMNRGSTFESYYKRADRLHNWRRSAAPAAYDIAIDDWDGKRKKYTPIDAALRHLTESYRPPFFLYVTSGTANRFAAFDSFEAWITRLRLLLADEPRELHPRLERYRPRWETAEEALRVQGQEDS